MSAAVVFVVECGLDIGSPIAAGLAAGGARVAWLVDSDAPPTAELSAGVLRLRAGFGSRIELEQAFAAASARCGAPTQVVISALPPTTLHARELVDLDDVQWGACRAAMTA